MVSKSCFRPPFWFGRFFRFLIGTRNVAYQPQGDHFHEVVLHGETLFFITSAIVAIAAEVGSGFTLRETCLATEVKQSFHETRPFYTLQSQLNLILFRSAFAHKFQLQFQRVTAASITFFGPIVSFYSVSCEFFLSIKIVSRVVRQFHRTVKLFGAEKSC